MEKLNICVMCGGPSAEREVSLRSGAAAAAALRSLGHQVSQLDPLSSAWELPAGAQVVFLALHGAYGEDGGVQARLEELGAPYTGCGPAASRVGFDKALAKREFLRAGVPTPRYEVLDTPAASLPRGWQPPVVLKPSRQGSSIGLQMVEREADWGRSLSEAFAHDSRVLMEEKIEGRETTVGILEDRPLPVAEIRVKNGLFDYRNKYTPGAAEHVCPADFDAATTSKIQTAALAAFHSIGGRDYARVDVMVAADGQPWVLEVNTLPGMTNVSIFPEIAAAAGLSYAELCQRMIELALRRGPAN